MAKATPQTEYVATGVTIPAEALNILRQAAVYRGEYESTRVSVSAALTDLILANRGILERRP